MKVREALYQIEQLDKLKCNLEKIASAVFRNENLSKEITEKAEISGDSPFFIISRAKDTVDGEIERIRNAMNEVEFDA